MNITDPIDKAYPKVKPLTQALVAAAKEQGATVEEFRMACSRVEKMIAKRTSRVLLSELESGGICMKIDLKLPGSGELHFEKAPTDPETRTRRHAPGFSRYCSFSGSSVSCFCCF